MKDAKELLNEAFEHHSSDRLDHAKLLYEALLRKNPNDAQVLRLMGRLFLTSGDTSSAVQCLKRAIALVPGISEYHNDFAMAIRRQGDLVGSILASRRAIELRHDNFEALVNLSVSLTQQGDYSEAVHVLRNAIQLRPTDSSLYFDLGVILKEQGRFDESMKMFVHTAALRPDHWPTLVNIGNIHFQQRNAPQALIAYRRALELNPSSAEVLSNLGMVFQEQGKLDAAIQSFKDALLIRPDLVTAHDNLLFFLSFHPDCTQRQLFEEGERWNHRHAMPMQSVVAPHSNNRDCNRTIRIGYVSANLCEHPVGRFMRSLIAMHDRSAFDVICYSGVVVPDQLTKEIMRDSSAWRSTIGKPDENLAAMIRDDRIDILVDLSLHLAGNRLLAFAMRPAPIQVTFGGYPGSTGLKTIDYRLSDPYLDPLHFSDDRYSERTLRLPDTFWCDHLMPDEPGVTTAPMLQNGYVTFGSLNNLCKVNESVLATWIRAMSSIADSRLLLLAPNAEARAWVLNRLAQGGIGPHRIEFVGFQSRLEYLRTYQRIDLVLDTWPYNGHSTSFDALWMGVPVVTMTGHTVVGRAGLSQLTNLGLSELVASDPQEFVNITSNLATDIHRLVDLRRDLRERMRRSPLTDAKRFAHGIESIFRSIWKGWCEAP